MRNFFSPFLGCVLTVISFQFAGAQELQATVTVISNRIKDVDQSTFQTLQTAIKQFLNTRKWTDDDFLPAERIKCNFILNIQQDVASNTFSAQLTVQSSRPVYNSDYETTMLNYQDQNVVFEYVQFQPLDFDPNRVAGNDPLQSNLTAILAYYVYIIIGLDYDSFSPRGGIPYFQDAQNIVNNAPEDSKYINGWQAFESNRNRYWLVDNLLNTRLSGFHEAMYQYHRMGLDKLYSDPNTARIAILNSLGILYTLNADNPNTMILQLFFLAKSDELIGIFSQAPAEDKQRAVQMLSELDVENATKYEQQLK
jgi:Domain of unknown function (DUF4835)